MPSSVRKISATTAKPRKRSPPWIPAPRSSPSCSTPSPRARYTKSPSPATCSRRSPPTSIRSCSAVSRFTAWKGESSAEPNDQPVRLHGKQPLSAHPRKKMRRPRVAGPARAIPQGGLLREALNGRGFRVKHLEHSQQLGYLQDFLEFLAQVGKFQHRAVIP